MNSEQEQQNAPATETAPPAAPPPMGKSPLGKSFNAGLLVAIAALAVSGWVWLDSRQTLHSMQEEMAKRLSDMDNRNKEGRILAGQAQEGTREALVKLGVLDSKVADSQSQQIALEALYQEMSRSRDEWALAEVEQTLLTASEQLQLAGNVKAALIALQTADSRLARLDRPQLLPVRKAIAQDIQRLQAVPFVDVPGISLRLDNLAASINDLPLALDHIPSPPAASPPKNTPPEGFWAKIVREARDDFFHLVRIQQMENPAAPLLSPSQATYLRENLRLRLLSARLALLQHDETSYRSDLHAVENALNRYFDTKAKPTHTALETLKQLNATSITVALPDLSASLGAVRSQKTARGANR